MKPRDVVSITTEDHPALANNLERALIEERENCIQGLISAKDWNDFVDRRAVIKGLNAAISLCEQVQKRLNA